MPSHLPAPSLIYEWADTDPRQPLLRLPYFPVLISCVAKALTLFLPTYILAFLIRVLMRFPSSAAHVTASFLKSRHGVRQALYMANDEMRTITTDKWDEEIWGAATTDTEAKRTVLRFLFAEKDHWYVSLSRYDYAE